MILNQYKNNINAILVGTFIGLIPPLSLLVTINTNRSINLHGYVYILGDYFPLYGELFTDFLIFFIAGLIVAIISKRHIITSSVIVGIIAPVIAATFTFFDLSIVLSNIIIFTFYTVLGSFSYIIFKSIVKKQ